MTHWKSLMDRDYLGHFDLPDGRDALVTIVKVVPGELKGGKKAKEHKPILHFEGKDKALIANTTNCKTLEAMYGEHIEGWVGKRVRLFVTTTSSPDGTVKCVRIRPTIPTDKGKGAAPPPPPPPTDAAGDPPFDDGATP